MCYTAAAVTLYVMWSCCSCSHAFPIAFLKWRESALLINTDVQSADLQIHMRPFNSFGSWIITSGFLSVIGCTGQFLLQTHPSAAEVTSIWILAKALLCRYWLNIVFHFAASQCIATHYTSLLLRYGSAHLQINMESKWPVCICDSKIYHEPALANTFK